MLSGRVDTLEQNRDRDILNFQNQIRYVRRAIPNISSSDIIQVQQLRPTVQSIPRAEIDYPATFESKIDDLKSEVIELRESVEQLNGAEDRIHKIIDGVNIRFQQQRRNIARFNSYLKKNKFIFY